MDDIQEEIRKIYKDSRPRKNSLDDIKKSIQTYGAKAVYDAAYRYWFDQENDASDSFERVGLLTETYFEHGSFIRDVACRIIDIEEGFFSCPHGLLERLGISLKDFSDLMGVTERTAKEYERSMPGTKYRMLKEFCEARSIDIDYPYWDD